MSLIENPFDKTPDGVNELGVKWWKDDSTTKYAQQKNVHDISLDVTVVLVESPDGYRTRLILENDKPIWEGQGLEEVGAYIDWLKVQKLFDSKEKF
jgi:hypothetical protein